MVGPYREIFAAPGTRAFTSAGLVARMPFSMGGIGIVTMLSQLRGEYGLAGAVAATFVLATAVISPQVSRLVDRFGQSPVLLPTALASAAALFALLACVRLGAPVWTFFVFAALAGCMPNMTSMVRARWTELYRGSPELNTAFAFESVMDEMSFIVGPALSVALCVMVFPEAGPLAAAVLLLVGVGLFAAQRRTEPPIHGHAATDGGSVVRIPALQVLMAALAAMGAIFGTVDVVTVAFTEQHGQPAAASVVLALYAGGSCLAGLAFGAARLATPLPRLFLIGVATIPVTTLALVLAGSVPLLGVAIFIAGMSIAPTMIVAMGMVERIVPASRLTEGMTWAITGASTGIAAGAAMAGRVVDGFGTAAGYGVALGFAVLTLAIALASHGLLRDRLATRRAAAAIDRAATTCA